MEQVTVNRNVPMMMVEKFVYNFFFRVILVSRSNFLLPCSKIFHVNVMGYLNNLTFREAISKKVFLLICYFCCVLVDANLIVIHSDR